MSKKVNESLMDKNTTVWYTQLYFGLRADKLRIANRIWGKGNNILELCELYQCHIDIPDTICQ